MDEDGHDSSQGRENSDEEREIRPRRSRGPKSGRSGHHISGVSGYSGTGLSGGAGDGDFVTKRADGDVEGSDDDQLKKDSSGSRSTGTRTTQLRKLQTRTWVLLFISEIILISLAAIQLASLKSLLSDGMELTVKNQVRFMEQLYEVKIEQLRRGFTALSQADEIVEFFEGDNSTNYQDLIEYEISLRRLEFVTLVSVILANANTQRVGEVWDQCDILKTFFSSPELGSLYRTCILEYSELNDEGSPLWRESDASYDALQHMYDDNNDGIIRWYVHGVYSADGTTLLGALVAGDIHKGKLTVEYESVTQLGNGFSMTVARNGVNVEYQGSYLLDEKNIEYAKVEFNSNDLIKEIVDTVDKDGVFSKEIRLDLNGKTYMVVAETVNEYTREGKPVENSESIAYFIRGYPMKQVNLIFSFLSIWNIALICGCIIFDVLSLLIALRLFLQPLEQLAQLVHLGYMKKAQKFLKKIELKKVFFVKILVTTVASTAFLAGTIVVNLEGIDDAYNEIGAAVTQLRVMDVTFALKIDEIALELSDLQHEDAMIDYLSNTTDPVSKANLLQLLEHMRDAQQIEYLTLVDRNAEIILTVNDAIAGTVFDPEGIATSIVNNTRTIIATVLIENDVFEEEGAPEWTDPLNGFEAATTQLDPRQTENIVVARIVATPMFEASNTEQLYADAVLIAGDIINGKMAISHNIVNIFNDGYAALYYFNGATNTFELLSSTLLDDKGDIVFDLRLDEDSALLERAQSDTEQIVTDIGARAAGYELEIAVDRIPFGTEHSCDGYSTNILREYDVPVYSVRGKDPSFWNSLKSSQLQLQIVILAFDLVSSLTITYLLYRPMRDFMFMMRDSIRGVRHHKKKGCFDNLLSKTRASSVSRTSAPDSVDRASSKL